MSNVFQQYNISPWLTPVRLVSVTNIVGTYTNGPLNNGVGATLTIAASSLTVDSVAVVAFDRILLQGQTAANQNGIYVVNFIGATVVLQRSADQQSIEQLLEGQYVTVGAGTVYAGSAFVLIEPLPAIFGISNMNWTASPLLAAAGFTAATGNITATTGNIVAGSSGNAGVVESYPAAASNGIFIFAAANNSNGFNSTISNSAVGQATVYTLPDPAAATAEIVVAPSALVSGNFVMASGTSGLVVDSGIPATSGRLFAQVSLTATQFNGMYATPVLLVAAPGANKMIIVESMQLCMTFVSADYAAGGVVAAQYDSTAHGAGVLATNTEAAADFFAAASTVFNFIGTSGNTVGILPFSTTVNKGLYLSNLTQPFTTGNSTWIVKVFYHVISSTS